MNCIQPDRSLMVYIATLLSIMMLSDIASAEKHIIDDTIQVIERHYLWTDELNADQALIKAAESLDL